MASFAQGLWESIITPGPTPALLVATNVTFAGLQLVLGVLLLATWSVHFVVLSVLSGGLWWAINWFARELKIHQLAEEKEKEEEARRARDPAVTSGESETEVEVVSSGTRGRKGGAAKTPSSSREIEGGEKTAELKQRAAAVPSTKAAPRDMKSSVSTEDEWEKVSENENEKDK